MNELKLFKSVEFGSVRTLSIDGEEWFLAKDIAKALGYEISNVSKMVKCVDEEEKIITRENNTMATFLTKEGVKQVLANSRKPNAIELLSEIDDWYRYKKQCKEGSFLNLLIKVLEPFGIKGVSQYQVLNYRIDYYIPSMNIAIEYDEDSHSNYTYEQHEGRQKEIENELGCRFIRINDCKDDFYNIGFVIKNIFNIRDENSMDEFKVFEDDIEKLRKEWESTIQREFED